MPVESFGVWSLIPPLLAIVLAIITRKAVLSLFLGVWSGGMIFTFPDSVELSGDWLGDTVPVTAVPGVEAITDAIPLVPTLEPTWLDVVANLLAVPVALLWAFPQTFQWIAESFGANTFHANILIFTLLLGSAVAMIWRLGGSYAVRDWALERLDTQRQGGATAFILGLVMFFDDYANTAIVGSTMKDVSDKLRISKEKFSYIVDSTAAPVATLMLSSWTAFQISLIEVELDRFVDAGELAEGDRPTAAFVFLESIPFNMYAVLAIVMVGIIVYTRRDYGEMLDAEHRSWSRGLISREDATPMLEIEGDLGEPNIEHPRLSTFFLPVVVLVVVTILTAMWTAHPVDAWWEYAGNAEFDVALVIGSFAMVASTYVLAYRHDLMSLGDGVDTTIDGFKLMLTAVSILVLAWSIGEVVDVLGTGEYVGGFAEEILTPEVLPVIVLVISAMIAFSTGTSWGTMAIMTPIAFPVAWEIVPDDVTFLAVIVGAIFSGAIFGDHSSPISDTSVLSSTFTGADLIDHVRTQLYYAVTVGLVAIVLLLIWGIGFVHVWGSSILAAIGLLVVGTVTLLALVYVLSEYDARRKGISPIAIRADQEVPMEAEVGDD